MKRPSRNARIRQTSALRKSTARTTLYMLVLVKGRLALVQKRILKVLGVRLDAEEGLYDLDYILSRLKTLDEKTLREILALSEYDESLVRNAGLLAKANASAVSDLTGIKGLARFDPSQVEAWRKENTDLIVSLVKDQVEDLKTNILERTQGLRVEEIQALIKDRFGVSDSRAELIARDQTLKLNAQMSRENFKRAGVSRYVWTTTRDERVRPEHEELDGQIFRFDDPPEPGNPGEDFQCRCTAFPVFDEESSEE